MQAKIEAIWRFVLREPYMHFLLIGVVLYFYYEHFHAPLATPSKQSITLSLSQIRDINQSSSKRWGRGLHSSELDIVMESSYLDEILLNEAVGLELEKRDKEMRNKLITQMRQILAPAIVEPSEKVLHKYYQNHKYDYGVTTEISFAHIYLHDLAHIDTKKFVEMLNLKEIKPKRASAYGDNVAKGNQIDEMTQDQAAKLFGNYFAQQVWKLSSHRWHGAIRSKHGYHILYITQKISTKLYPFDEIEDRVYNDYMAEQRETALGSAYAKLMTQYQLVRDE